MRLNPGLRMLCLGFSLLFSAQLLAAEFRSSIPAKLITYDAPSASSNKKYIVGQGYPLEVVVDLGAWVKVRDQKRGLSWVEGKSLSPSRTVLVTQQTDIKTSERLDAALVATVEQDVVLELVSTQIKQGWVQVKHRDGLEGYIRADTVWGLY